MKHIIMIIDEISEQMRDLPDEILDDAEKKIANLILKNLTKDSVVLEKLITHQSEQKFLLRLEQSHISKIEGWSEQVKEILDNLAKLNEQLQEDIKQLTYTLKNTQRAWKDAVRRMRMNMLRSEFLEDEDQIIELRKIETFEIDELKKIIQEEEAIAKLLD